MNRIGAVAEEAARLVDRVIERSRARSPQVVSFVGGFWAIAATSAS
jgi:predicted esterase YcpF (UPF0227 family)